jgi:ankyrin repeat protein
LFGGPPAPRNGDNLIAVMRALHDAGTDVNANAMYHHLARIRGGTALHYAVRAGSGPAIDELVAMGADVDQKDPDGLTALDYAMAHGYIPFLQMRQPPRLDLVEKLRGHGATVALAEEPYWAPVGPPIGYEATVWPLGVGFLSATYESLQPSEYVLDAVANRQYPGTPQPSVDYAAQDTQ